MKLYTQADLARIFKVSDSHISYLKRIGKIVPVITAKKRGIKNLYSDDAILRLEKHFAECAEGKGFGLYKETKCWSCLKSYNGCSWSREGTPVSGWKAKKVDIKLRNGRVAYIVLKCPEYEKEEWKMTAQGTLVRKNPIPEEWKVHDNSGLEELKEAMERKPFKGE